MSSKWAEGSKSRTGAPLVNFRPGAMSVMSPMPLAPASTFFSKTSIVDPSEETMPRPVISVLSVDIVRSLFRLVGRAWGESISPPIRADPTRSQAGSTDGARC